MALQKAGIHNYLSDDEVQFVRDQLATMRAKETYEPGKWYVSPLNRKPEVLGASLPSRMPKRVTLRDVTLRTAEQVPGVGLTTGDRRRLVRALIELGVKSLQVGMYSRLMREESAREEVRFIKSLDPDVEVEVGAITVKESIDRLADMGVNCASISGPANFAISPFYAGEVPVMAWNGVDWRKEVKPPMTMEELVERNKPLIDHAKKRGLKIQAWLNMLLYASEEHIEQFARDMGNSGVDYIVLLDGPGGMGPQAIAHAVTTAKRAAPHTKIVVHLHNTFNLGVAINLAAVQAGAEVLEVAVNGYSSGNGQTDLAQIAAALEVLYGVDTGIRLDRLTALRRLGEDITRVPVARNHPVTGEEYFNWGGTESITQELPVDPLIHWCVRGSVFGNQDKWTITRASGHWGMFDKLTQLGITVEKAEVDAILAEVMEEILIRKRSLTDEEFRSMALRIKGGIEA
ncbi:MAG: hypothetical protein HYX92_08295 [Chloroflexi bacterium]|nr:hypothetical protein [Chloroflexota bacterium]